MKEEDYVRYIVKILKTMNLKKLRLVYAFVQNIA